MPFLQQRGLLYSDEFKVSAYLVRGLEAPSFGDLMCCKRTGIPTSIK